MHRAILKSTAAKPATYPFQLTTLARESLELPSLDRLMALGSLRAPDSATGRIPPETPLSSSDSKEMSLCPVIILPKAFQGWRSFAAGLGTCAGRPRLRRTPNPTRRKFSVELKETSPSLLITTENEFPALRCLLRALAHGRSRATANLTGRAPQAMWKLSAANLEMFPFLPTTERLAARNWLFGGRQTGLGTSRAWAGKIGMIVKTTKRFSVERQGTFLCRAHGERERKFAILSCTSPRRTGPGNEAEDMYISYYLVYTGSIGPFLNLRGVFELRPRGILSEKIEQGLCFRQRSSR